MGVGGEERSQNKKTFFFKGLRMFLHVLEIQGAMCQASFIWEGNVHRFVSIVGVAVKLDTIEILSWCKTALSALESVCKSDLQTWITWKISLWFWSSA